MKHSNLFNSVRVDVPVARNPFNLTYRNSFDAEFGILYPVFRKGTYAGEIYEMYSESFIRTIPMIAPSFMEADVSIHAFFVPYRLIYEDWTDFITRGKDGNTDYDKPYYTIDQFAPPESALQDPIQADIAKLTQHGSLFDFLNFPSHRINSQLQYDANDPAKIDLMPYNAYNLIYNEYYRDENLIPEVSILDHSGKQDNVDQYTEDMQQCIDDYGVSPFDANRLVNPFYLRRRAWRKDYFTACLPFIQKGPQISLIGGISSDGLTSIPVTVQSSYPQVANSRLFVSWWNNSGSTSNDGELKLHNATTVPSPASVDNYSSHIHLPQSVSSANATLQIRVPLDQLQTNVMTLADLRVGLAITQWFELNARVGSDRYFEYLLGHFGVRDRDSRLQRPEYLGGFTHEIQVSEVEQTSESGTTPQGNLSGKGLGYSVNTPIRYRCPEPGYIMHIYSIRPKTAYFRGLPREYTRWDAFDYYDRFFDHLSEQPVYKSELYYDWSIHPHSDDDTVFGYIPRFAEERTSLDEVHGEFRDTLDYWTGNRRIDSSVSLNRDFIEVNALPQGLNKVFVYEGTAGSPAHPFICHVRTHCVAIRPMSKYATPKLV